VVIMKSYKRKTGIFFLWVSLLLVPPIPVHADGVYLDQIKLPDGFRIEVFAEDVPNARSLALADNGTLFVSTRSAGRVYAVSDLDGDHQADITRVIADGLNMPNGVAVKGGDLYVAEVNRVLRYEGLANDPEVVPKPVVVNANFPRKRHHGWKYIAFGPDGRLYVPVGAPCNVCDEEDPRFASIMRMDDNGNNLEIFARGIRNTVGFDWHPRTGELWFTNNGRDWMGDDLPPDTLHRAPQKGLHFGFPYCHGGSVPDPDFGQSRRCGEFAPRAATLGAHVAPLGMKFYTGNMFPTEYKNRIFIAEHGSWNRSKPVGYRITMWMSPKTGHRPMPCLPKAGCGAERPGAALLTFL
jgi:glucose/arabinose dehydrogenase